MTLVQSSPTLTYFFPRMVANKLLYIYDLIRSTTRDEEFFPFFFLTDMV